MKTANDIVTTLRNPAVAATILRAIAEQTGDARYARAAGMLSGGHGGRPTRDDSDALLRMAALIANGTADTPEQAGRYLARTMDGEHSTAAAAARLARKFRQQN
jgi:hypothetical protein